MPQAPEIKRTRVKLCSLWKHQLTDGATYLQGNLQGLKITVMPNGFKKTDKHPDYHVYLTQEVKVTPTNGEGENQGGNGL